MSKEEEYKALLRELVVNFKDDKERSVWLKVWCDKAEEAITDKDVSDDEQSFLSLAEHAITCLTSGMEGPTKLLFALKRADKTVIAVGTVLDRDKPTKCFIRVEDEGYFKLGGESAIDEVFRGD
jgi:hypothetical protein